jgi:hypothetical protein
MLVVCGLPRKESRYLQLIEDLPRVSHTLVSASPLGKALPGTRQGPYLKCEGRKKASPLGGEGSVLKKDPLPSGGAGFREKDPPLTERKERTGEGSGHLSKVKDARHMAIPRNDLLSPPGKAHGGRSSVVHCCGLAEGTITAAGAVMMDKTGWSCSIGAVRQMA